MLNNEIKVQVCDATNDDESYEAGIKIFSSILTAIVSLQ